MADPDGTFDYGEDATPEIGDNTNAALRELAVKMLAAQAVVTDIEEKLRVATVTLTNISDSQIPIMMDEIGHAKVTTKDGMEITVKETYRASIPLDNQPEAFRWLRDNGFGKLIKNEIKVSLGMKQDKEAAKAVKALKALGLEVERKTTIHHVTLSTFILERVKEGEDISLELFGAFRQRRAKIKVKDK